MRLLAALLSFAVLAGCLGPADAPGPADGADAGGDEGRSSRSRAGEEANGTYEAEFHLRINPDGTAGTVCVAGTCFDHSDCASFRREDGSGGFAVANGTALLTWTAATPTAQEFVLFAGGSETLSTSGPSPLALPLERLEPDRNGRISFWVDHDLPDVPVDQEVTLGLSFAYEGVLPAPQVMLCSYGLL